MDKNAVYFGGSDPGRFVPTFMAFVESQQDNRWKREPDFDRRDVTVITQNALCDSYYANYIRTQYDPRFRPSSWTPFERWLGRDRAYPEKPVTCVSLSLIHILIQDAVVAHDDEGHARGVGTMSGADVERLDVESAPAEQTGDARQNAETVFDQDGNGVTHSAAIKGKGGGAVNAQLILI